MTSIGIAIASPIVNKPQQGSIVETTTVATRLNSLETKTCMMQESLEDTEEYLTNLTNDFKILVAEFRILNNWICKQFGVELFNPNSALYKKLNPNQPTNEYEEMIKDLNSVSCQISNSTNALQPLVNLNQVNNEEAKLVQQHSPAETSRELALLETIDEIFIGSVEDGSSVLTVNLVDNNIGGIDATNRVPEELAPITIAIQSKKNTTPKRPKLSAHHKQVKSPTARLGSRSAAPQSFNCNICPKLYNTNGGLERHIQRAHTSPDLPHKFICTECNLSWPEKWELVRHMKDRHVGRRRQQLGLFTCNICQQTYVTNSSLKRHIRTIHNQIQFQSSSASNTPQDLLVSTNKRSSNNTSTLGGGDREDISIVFDNFQTNLLHNNGVMAYNNPEKMST